MTDDLLWRNLKDLPAFRGLLRAVEARFYQDIALPEPTLDLGCGDAHFASVAFDHPLTAGVDPWTAPLAEARRLRPQAYRLLSQADGAALPFPDDHFASAVSNSVLEHIPVLEPVLSFVNEFRAELGKPAERLFVSCGTYESLIYENRSLVPLLQQTGMDVKYVEAKDGHNWENWRDRLREGLSWLFPGPIGLVYE